MGRIDINNMRFGRLLAQHEVGKTPDGILLVMCLCDCGNTTIVRKGNLTTGNTESCGCLQRDAASDANRRHSNIRAVTHLPEYSAWKHMLGRCCRPKSAHAFPGHAGRGITVCTKWQNSFDTFLQYIGSRPSSKHSLDRIDNDGNYEPGNVRWATAKEQANNKRKASITATRLHELLEKERLLDECYDEIINTKL